MKFDIGPGMPCDLEILAERRMLIQASSGGGKSRTLRRILEQTHGKMQQIIIDPEGELVSLREKFDYILVTGPGGGGDTVAHPRTAPLLAERILELGVSAIIDLFEVKPRARVEFMRIFAEALIEMPKRLWHPYILAVDEMQMFAPEGAQCESTPAMIDGATRGRKRGMCMIGATQRISLLDKNVAAILHNKLIGFTSLDTDLKRAAFELGFDKEKMLSLREMEPMTFWGFGPALTRAPTLFTVGPHVTTHPKPGAKIQARIPPPTEKVKALLPKLADLPAEAEHRHKTEAELKQDNADLRRQLALAKREQPAPQQVVEKPKTVTVDRPVITHAQLEKLRIAGKEMEKLATEMHHKVTWFDNQVVRPFLAVLEAPFKDSVKPTLVEKPGRQVVEAVVRALAPPPSRAARVYSADMADAAARQAQAALDRTMTGDGDLAKGERVVLTALAQNPDGLTREQLTTLTGYARSTRDKYLQPLAGRDALRVSGALFFASETGLSLLGAWEPLPHGAELLGYWRARLPEGERRLLDVVVASWPNSIERDAAGQSAGVARSTRDKYLQKLTSRKLVESVGTQIRASQLLFD